MSERPNTVIRFFAVGFGNRKIIGTFFPSVVFQIGEVFAQVTQKSLLLLSGKVHPWEGRNPERARAMLAPISLESLVSLLRVDGAVRAARGKQHGRNWSSNVMLLQCRCISLLKLQRLWRSVRHSVLGRNAVHAAEIGCERQAVRQGKVPHREVHRDLNLFKLGWLNRESALILSRRLVRRNCNLGPQRLVSVRPHRECVSSKARAGQLIRDFSVLLFPPQSHG